MVEINIEFLTVNTSKPVIMHLLNYFQFILIGLQLTKYTNKYFRLIALIMIICTISLNEFVIDKIILKFPFHTLSPSGFLLKYK